MTDASVSAKPQSSPKSPTIVEVGYKVNCISNVSVVSSTYEIDINVNLYWKDPRAIGMEEKSQLDIGGYGIDYENDYDGNNTLGLFFKIRFVNCLWARRTF